MVRSSPQKKEVERHTIAADLGHTKLEASPGELNDPMMGLDAGNINSEKIEKIEGSIEQLKSKIDKQVDTITELNK